MLMLLVVHVNSILFSHQARQTNYSGTESGILFWKGTGLSFGARHGKYVNVRDFSFKF